VSISGLTYDLLAIATREGATKGGDSGLGKMKELSLVDNDVVQGVALATKDVVSAQDHGEDALLMGERVHLGLLSFGCFLGVVELATGLGMGVLGGFELEIGLLDRGLGLGDGGLECGDLSNVRVGGGHGRRRSKKGKLDTDEQKKGKKHNSRLLLFVRQKNTRGSEREESHQRWVRGETHRVDGA